MSFQIENINLEIPQSAAKSSRKIYLYKGKSFLPEQAVMEHYKDMGYKVLWSENTYWWEIMCLLFWNEIFAKVYGSVDVSEGGVTRILSPKDPMFNRYFDMFVPLNGIPADFFTNEFYNNRQSILNSRLVELRDTDYIAEVKKAYADHKGEPCRPIENWGKYSAEELVAPLQFVSKETVLKILQRLLSNFSELRSGIPDLIAYKAGETCFIEVKSEKDKLSDRQRDWIVYLDKNLGQKVTLSVINHSSKKIENIEMTIKSYQGKTPIKTDETEDPQIANETKLQTLDNSIEQPKLVSSSEEKKKFPVWLKVVLITTAVILVLVYWNSVGFYVIGGALILLAVKLSNKRHNSPKPVEVNIARKQGPSRSILDQHFKYLEDIRMYYRNRDNDPKALENAILACEGQIALAPEAKKAFERQHWGLLPSHTGFLQLSIIEEKRGNYGRAVELCNTALSQGWSGDWQKRIERCTKRI